MATSRSSFFTPPHSLCILTLSALSFSVHAGNLTRDNGAAVGDNQNSQTAGAHGPVLLQDMQLIQKLQRFDRERIPERVVHARGTGAHGRRNGQGDAAHSHEQAATPQATAARAGGRRVTADHGLNPPDGTNPTKEGEQRCQPADMPPCWHSFSPCPSRARSRPPHGAAATPTPTGPAKAAGRCRWTTDETAASNAMPTPQPGARNPQPTAWRGSGFSWSGPPPAAKPC